MITEARNETGESARRRVHASGRMQRHFRSRKWTAGMIGTGAVLLVFSATMLAICISPVTKMQGFVAIANLALVALGAISGSLITGQSFVDWRHGSENQFSAQSVDVERHLTKETTTRNYAPKHYDEDGI